MGWGRPASWPLRLRFLLFFALIAGVTAAVAIAMMVVAAQRLAAGGAVAPTLALAGGVTACAAVGVTLWVWRQFDQHVAGGIRTAASVLHTHAFCDHGAALDPDAARYLAGLGPAITEATQALAAAREDTQAAIASASAEDRHQLRRLESVLQDLDQGIVICSLKHEILLYNAKALQILQVTGDCGLGRSLLRLVSGRPLVQALERLEARAANPADEAAESGPSTLFVGTCADGRTVLKGRVSLTLSVEGERPIGYAVAFEDVTTELAAGVSRDRLLHRATDSLRRGVGNLLAIGEALVPDRPDDPALAAEAQQVFATERRRLADDLERLEHASSDLLASAWPMVTKPAPVLLRQVARQVRRDLALDCIVDADPVGLYCDPDSVVDLIGHLLGCLVADGLAGTAPPRLVAKTGTIATGNGTLGSVAAVDVELGGPPPDLATLDGWLDQPLAMVADGSAVSGKDVLFRHRTTVWPERMNGRAGRLRLPMAVSSAGDEPADGIAMRPEFYDFDLSAGLSAEEIDDQPLTSLTFVVFDTETTGLAPSAGDQIVSIAGVRLVNGRRLRGDVLDTLVHPGRHIPAAATRIHGIADADVAAAPSLGEALGRFAAFVDRAVLVAHNAAFDMNFVTRHPAGQELAGRPVLDTVLLAAHVLGADQPLTLDDLSTRFSITIPERDRHTALGDAVATADVLISLFPLLEAAGVRTLRDAVEASNLQAALRRRQRY